MYLIWCRLWAGCVLISNRKIQQTPKFLLVWQVGLRKNIKYWLDLNYLAKKEITLCHHWSPVGNGKLKKKKRKAYITLQTIYSTGKFIYNIPLILILQTKHNFCLPAFFSPLLSHLGAYQFFFLYIFFYCLRISRKSTFFVCWLTANKHAQRKRNQARECSLVAFLSVRFFSSSFPFYFCWCVRSSTNAFTASARVTFRTNPTTGWSYSACQNIILVIPKQ